MRGAARIVFVQEMDGGHERSAKGEPKDGAAAGREGAVSRQCFEPTAVQQHVMNAGNHIQAFGQKKHKTAEPKTAFQQLQSEELSDFFSVKTKNAFTELAQRAIFS